MQGQELRDTICEMIDALRSTGSEADLLFAGRYGQPYIRLTQDFNPEVDCELRPLTGATFQLTLRGSVTERQGWDLFYHVEDKMEETVFSLDADWKRTTKQLNH